MNKERIYIGFFVFSLLLFAAFEWLRPDPIDWTESYSGLDKRPFGCYIMRDLLPDLFPGADLSYQNEPIFTVEKDTAMPHNTIFVNRSFTPDTFETDRLLKQAKAGHNIFIASSSITGHLADTLDIDTDRSVSLHADSIQALFSDTVHVNFSNPQLSENSPWNYAIAGVKNIYFSGYDTLRTTVLRTSEQKHANFIKIDWDKGAFFLHTIPHLFTNYYMVHPHKAKYASKVLSYLPVQATTWDEYYKLGRSTAGSPMRYIVEHRYLRWGWFTAIAGLLLFMVFRAKRRQRIIPDIQQPKNTTVQFTKTIGRLYFEHGNRKDIAEKKISYLLEYIRTKLRLNTDTYDQEFLYSVSGRAGIEYETVSKLFNEISTIQQKPELSSKELFSIHHKIEHFYQQTSR
ncbi:MAG: DUF4350 domain-containing protein [Balneolaceae bacterium]|nr:DUF4350 domain-containing protein [Balneolaceae bacterium]